MTGGRDKANPDLDERTFQIAERLLNTPPKPHDEMKIDRGKTEPSGKPSSEAKTQPARKGRIHKGRTGT